jgi:RNA polymerase primary sigma factor
LNMYYGLSGYIAMSLEEISTKLNLTSERVRQVKSKALRKLKAIKNTKRLMTYL